MNASPIAIFDSGVGGLTVMKEVISLLPGEDVIYFGDSYRCPYGPRPLAEVRDFAFEILEHLSALEVKLVIIACNTATAAALEEAQNHYQIPIIGVIEPGAHGAVQTSENRRIGVIATQGTVGSGTYERYLKQFDAGVEVISVACPGFVEFVEAGQVEGREVIALAKEYFKPLLAKSVDTVILGCTHYPLLADAIEEALGGGVKLISSAQETAREVKAILRRRGHLNDTAREPRYRFLSTGDPDLFGQLGTRFLGRSLCAVEKVDL